MSKDQVKAFWDYIQSLLDVSGDVWLGFFTACVLLRLILVIKGYPGLTMPEATAYSFAVGAFAYSNKGPKV
jgi:ABC-type transporter Mla maintaining outer membrane lipid asymmetry permease subunit MlaE